MARRKEHLGESRRCLYSSREVIHPILAAPRCLERAFQEVAQRPPPSSIADEGGYFTLWIPLNRGRSVLRRLQGGFGSREGGGGGKHGDGVSNVIRRHSRPQTNNALLGWEKSEKKEMRKIVRSRRVLFSALVFVISELLLE